MTTQQPEALRLADAVRTHDDHPRVHFYNRVADELRRQHARIVELEAQLAAARQAVQDDVPTDDELRMMWIAAGGDFFGPDKKNGFMPASKLFPFLRQLAAPAHPAEGVPAQAAKLPPLPEPTAFLVCKGSEVTARAWNVDQMRAYASAAIAATHSTKQGMDDLHKQMLKALESVGAHTVTDCDGDEITAYFCNWQAISDAKRAGQAKQGEQP